MPQDLKTTIGHLSSHLLQPGMVDYLESQKFARFCREHDLSDVWSEALGYSGDTPDLYGDAITKKAFLMLVRHLYRSRMEEFPELLAALLADFYTNYPGPEFVSIVLDDLADVGYTRKYMEAMFSKAWK
jgi:hypothetical protein